MPGQVNNNLLGTNNSQNKNQAFGITLDGQSITSLQQSINNLASQLSSTNSSTATQNQNSNIATNNQNQTSSSSSTSSTTSTTNAGSNTLGFTIDPNTGEIIFVGDGGSGVNTGGGIDTGTDPEASTTKAKSHIAGFKEDKAARTTNNSNRRPVVTDEPTSTIPKIQVPFFERQPVGSNATLADGTTIETYKNDDGTTTEVTVKPDGQTTTKTFEDFPLDNQGNPTGFRTTIVANNGSVTVLTTIINDLGDGNFSTVTTDITDTANPLHATSSALHASEARDDEGNIIYNSSTSSADGFSESITNEALGFPEAAGLDRPSGYRSTYAQRDSANNIYSIITETISYTDENGQRITILFDVTDPDDVKELSRTFRPDPMTGEKTSGQQISDYLDKVNQYGLMDITGDGELDPMSDLLLIYRYLQGQRGAALTANINLGASPKPTAEIEEKIDTALKRGLFDVNGSDGGNDVYEDDLKILARYMMGARGEVLLDGKQADNDSIEIAQDGSNLLSVAANNPLLLEIQEIFGVDGKELEFTGTNGARQNYNLFFVNTEIQTTTGFSGGSPKNGPGSYRRY